MPLEQPLLPPKLLRNGNYVAISSAACVGTMIYFSMNVLWPEQIAVLYTTDPVRAGWLAVSLASYPSTHTWRLIANMLVHNRIRGGFGPDALWPDYEAPGPHQMAAG
jgi:hypothetical protein